MTGLRGVKRFLSPRQLAIARRVVFACRAAALRFASVGSLPSSVYYAVLSPAFYREHRSVAFSVRRNFDREGDVTLYKLRRNIHRLEKGLLMRPRRTPFALDYVDETVDLFLASHELGGSGSTGDLAWAGDVLALYFEVVGTHPMVKSAQMRFERVRPKFAPTRVPSVREATSLSVGYPEFLELVRARHSVRWFEQRPVSRALIDQAVAAASHAPSSCNRQPFTYRIFDDRRLVRQVAGIPLGTAGFLDNIPVVAVLVGDLSAFFSERDRHGIYIDASLSAMLFMLALETLGLASCPLNWPDIGRLEKRMHKLLGLETHERVIMLVAIGHPDPTGMVAHSQRRPVDSVRSFNRDTAFER